MNSARFKAMPVIETGVCRFCGHNKKCRVINIEYENLGQREVYSEMLLECFGILLSNLDRPQKERLVCASCVHRLRAACSFKNQVLKCEETLKRKIEEENEGDVLNFQIKTESQYEMHVEYLDDESTCNDSCSDSVCDETYSECGSVDTGNVVLIKEKSPPLIQTEDDSLFKKEPSRIFKDTKPIFDTEGTDETETFKKPKPKSLVTKSKMADKERDMRLRKMLLMKMAKLKEQSKLLKAIKPKPEDAKTSAKYSKVAKERMALNNAVQIVNGSYVCPFNNINGHYYCFYCRTFFTDPKDLREHTTTHEPRLFERSYPKKKALKIDITRIDCRLCDAKIDDIPTLKEHLSKAHGKKIYTIDNEFLKFKLTHPNIDCFECGNSFLFIDNLIDHMATHFGTHICDKCGATFVQLSSLEAHIRCHNKTNVAFPCQICGKVLTTNRSRYVHMSVVHEKKPIIDCFNCEEMFFSYDQRNQHMVKAHGHKMTFPCTLCDKVLDSRKKFLTHNRDVHLKIRNHECEICGKKYPTSHKLKVHSQTHK
ncbi:hypothetical protein JYU34_017921 [Plutella xylostella]|uniref:Uncharacterized protein n=1 Tax=Plutella xylostella TaxID=51655 RepID=A0ABQ7PZK2_PLUXY|nr:hypothetical protein JYU34_017921 [Plutella xylostella]